MIKASPTAWSVILLRDTYTARWVYISRSYPTINKWEILTKAVILPLSTISRPGTSLLLKAVIKNIGPILLTYFRKVYL